MKILILMWLGVLVACGPAEKGEAPALDSPRQKTAALVTPDHTLTWTGGGGSTDASAVCLKCNGANSYACLPASPLSSWTKSFADSVPADSFVVGIEAKVVGESVKSNQSVNTTVEVSFNDAETDKLSLGSFTSDSRSCTGGNPAGVCETGKNVSKTNSAGINSYNYGGINTITLKPSTDYYCVAHVEIYLTLAPRQGLIRVEPDAPAELDFGKQKRGVTSVPRTVTVFNDGNKEITVSALTLSASTPFAIVPNGANNPNAVFKVPANGSRSFPFDVTFTPTALTSSSVELSIHSDAANATGGVTKIQLKGVGVEFSTGVSTDETQPLLFGEQPLLNTSTTKKVVVYNAGSAALQVQTLLIDAPFQFAPGQITTFNLPPGQSQDVLVAFRPTVAQDATGYLTVNTAAPTDRPTVRIEMQGKGVNPTLSLTTTGMPFGDRIVGATPSTSRVTLSNGGNGTLVVKVPATITGKPFTISPSGTFEIRSDGDATRPPVELTVTFTPTPTAMGSQSAILGFTNAQNVAYPQSVSLTGRGVSAFVIDVAEPPLEFGPVRVGTNSDKIVKFTNISSVPITLSNLATTALPFSIHPTTTTSITIPAKESGAAATVPVTVRFNPQSETTFAEVLNWTAPATNAFSPTKLDLSGTGKVSRSEFKSSQDAYKDVLDSGATLNFGGVRLNTTGEITVRLTNNGDLPLIFRSGDVTVADTETPGSASRWFFYRGPPSGTIDAGKSLDFVLSFAPTAEKEYYNSIFTFRSNAANSPMVLNLQGQRAYSLLTVSPAVLGFGDVPVSTQSAPKSVTISNQGSATVMLQEPAVGGPFRIIYPVGAKAPFPIKQGSPFTFEVVFNPYREATETGSITISDPDGDVKTLTVSLGGRGTVAKLSILPANFVFNNQRVNVTSGVQAVTLKNEGNAPLYISQLFSSDDSVFTVEAPAVFRSDAGVDGGLTIGPGQGEIVKVSFTPKELGDLTGTLFIQSSSVTAWTNPVMTGRGVAGQISLDPANVNFGDVAVDGTATAQQQVLIKNIGEASLTINGIVPPPDRSFSVSGLSLDGGTLLLGSGAQWPVTVTFKPVQRGSFFTSTVIQSDSFSSPMLPLPLSGTGVAAAVVLVPDEIPFGQSNLGTPTVKMLGINNPGEKTLVVSGIAFTDVEGNDGGVGLDFKTSMSFQQSVDAGATLTVPIEFTPRNVGTREARAIIYSNARTADGGHAEARLWGEGTVPGLRLEPTSLSFGDVVVGSPVEAILKLTNTGSGPLTVKSITASGPDMASFSLAAPPGEQVLVKDASMSVVVTLTPSEERTFLANLMVSTNNVAAPNVNVPLRGTGVRHQVHAEPSPVSFGNQLVNANSNWRVLTITNNRKEVVSIRSITVEGPFERDPAVTTPRDLQGKPDGQDGGTVTGANKLDVGVRIKPLAEGEVRGKLRIAFTDLALRPIEVELQGTGIPAALSISPSALDFGAIRAGGEARPLTFTINNLTDDELDLGKPVVVNSDGELFDYDWASLESRKLGARERYSVTVGYTPQGETSSDSTLNFGTKRPAWVGSAILRLQGRAVKRILGVDPEILDFGRVEVGKPMPTKEVTITNQSAYPQKVLVSLGGDGKPFVLGAKSLDAPLQPGGVATFTLGFAPEEAGLVENEVRIALQGDTVADAVIPVTGYGRKQEWKGGGGCSLGGTQTGFAALVALVALAGMGSRRRRRE
ncbi:choice-of-anchor D domain-containing protein [Archangium sp.]|uniref:choice-of-anchor D domain-containing protein n=1 Tax=Archangium sp. TaxID=1872627 RepID=UPI00286CCA29|nr:choice-of-anchor D domain-containing protein [Archangium sp.]